MSSALALVMTWASSEPASPPNETPTSPPSWRTWLIWVRIDWSNAPPLTSYVEYPPQAGALLESAVMKASVKYLIPADCMAVSKL